MPIGVCPEDRARCVLPADRRLPEDKQPYFLVRFPTARETLRIDSLMERAVKEKDDEKSLALLLEALSLMIADYQHVTGRDQKPLHFSVQPVDYKHPDGTVLCTVPAGIAVLPDHLTHREMWQLYAVALEATRTTEIELGKSDSPSASSTGSSAPTAGPTQQESPAPPKADA